MNWTSAVAIYFIIWWLVLFVVLPFGVRNAAEVGDTVEGGNDEGAPVAHGLKWKAGVTTAVATVVFAIVYWLLVNDVLGTLDLPFFRDMPKL
jgi:predicted secreted protein